MAKKKATTPTEDVTISPDEKGIFDLSRKLSTPPNEREFKVWIVGNQPLITHAWSQKAKIEMLGKQVGSTKSGGKEKRDPHGDFLSGLYPYGDEGVYGFPTTGLKNSLLTAGHKDKGLAKTTIMQNLFLRGKLVPVATAHGEAMCTMPLSRIYGPPPKMREDSVRIGSGLQKVASLAYRPQFWPWAILLEGTINMNAIQPSQLAFLIDEAGQSIGIGEWRNERHGPFGAFRRAFEEEGKLLDAYMEDCNREFPIKDIEY